MKVRILTGREMQGPKWAAKHPSTADDLWVVVTGSGRRERHRIGPPTQENR